MLDLDIQIIKTTTPKDKPTDEGTLGFGKMFTDHMFIVEYTEGIGWHDARIQPYGPLRPLRRCWCICSPVLRPSLST